MQIDYSLFSQVRIANDKLRRAFDNNDSALARKALIDMVSDASKMLRVLDPSADTIRAATPIFAEPEPEPEPITSPPPPVEPKAFYASGRAKQFPWSDHPRLERFLIGRFLKGDLPHIDTILEMMSDATGHQATIGQWRNKIHNHLPPKFVIDAAKRPSKKVTWEMIWVAGSLLSHQLPQEGARRNDQWIRHISIFLGVPLSCGSELPALSTQQTLRVKELVALYDDYM